MAQNIEKRGMGLNDACRMKQFITLRNGEFKYFDSDTLRLLGRIFLHEKFTYTIDNKHLELHSTFPSISTHIYKFVNEKELLSWYDAIKESQEIEQRKQKRRLHLTNP